MEVLGHNKSLKGAGQVSPGCVRNCSLGTIVASTVASSRQCGCRPVHAERSPGADVIAAAPVTSPEQKRRRWFQIIVTYFGRAFVRCRAKALQRVCRPASIYQRRLLPLTENPTKLMFDLPEMTRSS